MDWNVEQSGEIERRLIAVDLSWERLQRNASTIILFGSFVQNPRTSYNDIDVLCVGYGTTRITPRIDLIWLTTAEMNQNEWLSSELAGHVAEYGLCIQGDFSWRHKVFVGEQAIRRKRKQIEMHITAAAKYWETGGDRFRRRQYCLIRRQVQRLQLLSVQKAVPHTSALDKHWADAGKLHKEQLLRNTSLSSKSIRWLLAQADKLDRSFHPPVAINATRYFCGDDSHRISKT